MTAVRPLPVAWQYASSTARSRSGISKRTSLLPSAARARTRDKTGIKKRRPARTGRRQPRLRAGCLGRLAEKRRAPAGVIGWSSHAFTHHKRDAHEQILEIPNAHRRSPYSAQARALACHDKWRIPWQLQHTGTSAGRSGWRSCFLAFFRRRYGNTRPAGRTFWMGTGENRHPLNRLKQCLAGIPGALAAKQKADHAAILAFKTYRHGIRYRFSIECRAAPHDRNECSAGRAVFPSRKGLP